RAHAEGWRVAEVPFVYKPRIHGSSHARLFKFGLAYLRTFWSLWGLRNSIVAADYDDRAYDSAIPLQRYWQRSRYRHLTSLIEGEGEVLDVGCGSSRVIGALPEGSIGLDILIRKLRYSRKFSRPLGQGSAFGLPFAHEFFPCVLCSEVIEHIPKDPLVLDEICRVVRDGGRLVLGTPDYSRWEWVVTEKLYGFLKPGGYADEHIAHYTRDELTQTLGDRGVALDETRYILRGELILAFRKQPTPGNGKSAVEEAASISTGVVALARVQSRGPRYELIPSTWLSIQPPCTLKRRFPRSSNRSLVPFGLLEGQHYSCSLRRR